MAINRELSQFGRLVTINDNEHIGIGTTSNISIGFGTITATSITASSFIGDGSGLTNLPTGGTSSQQLYVTGISTFQSDIHLGDNDKLIFGDSNEFQIRHLTNGDSAITEGGLGQLYIGGNIVNIASGYNSVFSAKFTPNNSVELYHNNTKKFETIGTGATVTGDLYATTFYGNVTGNVTGNANTASALETSRTISLSGDVSGSASFDGSANATITATVADDSHNHVISNVDGLQTALDAKAPLASPALTGTPTAPTAAAGTNTTQIATTAFVSTAVANVIDSAPGALDTLNELAAALGDDANFSTTVTNSIATKLPLSGGEMTGNITFSGSQTVDGRDLSVDGAKLDGIESGATADQTASEILTLIKTVDGTGSGLDADTLDTLHASSFLRSDTIDTFTGNYLILENTSDVKLQLKCPSGDTNDWNYIEYYGRDGTRDGYVGTNSSGILYVSQDGGSTIELSTTNGLAYINGNKIWTQGNDGSGSGLDADLLDGYNFSAEQGPSAVGNFGQWQGHNTYSNFNTVPSYWGWNYVLGNTNAPNTNSSQWYRSRLSLGSEYGYGSDSSDYWLEMAIPRDSYSGNAGGLWIRTCENGSEQGWHEVASKVSGNTVWHAGNDGSGSGLDADLLDGQQGSYYLDYNNLTNVPSGSSNADTLDNLDSSQFLRSDTADTSSRMLSFYTNMSSQEDYTNSPISIRERDAAGSGDGEDRDSPNINFHWAGRVSKSLWMGSNGYLNWGEYSASGVPASDGTLRAGNFIANSQVSATDFNSTSDINLKKNIEKIESPLDKLSEISGVTFQWIENDKQSGGVIAQDVEKVMPELVGQIEDHKSVNYNGLIGLLVECVKEQQKQIGELKSLIGA